MKSVDIRDIDINSSFYHFTSKNNLQSIEENGLVASIGDASKMVDEKHARVYMSKGGKGVLGIKNNFIYKYIESRICDIPNEYRKYFDVKDWSSTEKIAPDVVYAAMERRLKDEVYLKVDAKEGEDFLPEEMHGARSEKNDVRDIKGKPDHNIDVDKLSILRTENGDTAFDIVQYFYNRMLQLNPDKVNLIKDNLSSLAGMFDYIKNRDEKSTQALGKETLEELKDTQFINKLESTLETQEKQISEEKSI